MLSNWVFRFLDFDKGVSRCKDLTRREEEFVREGVCDQKSHEDRAHDRLCRTGDDKISVLRQTGRKSNIGKCGI